MAQYSIHSDYRTYIGLDVHARTVSASGIDLMTGEIKKKRFDQCPGASDIATWIQASFEGPYYAAYESGCTGFHLARQLRIMGIASDVIAVSSIARSDNERKRKNDLKDARRLLQEMITPSSPLTRVWMPDEELEGMRDIARAHADGVLACKRLKQQRSALLLRHGFVWNERTPKGNLKTTSGNDYERWLNQLEFDSTGAFEAFSYYRSALREATDRVGHLEVLIRGHAEGARFKPYVDALSCLKSISLASAFLYTVEIGVFSRFKNPRALASYFGLTPSSNASGDDREANGHITKAGSGQARLALIEGLQNVGGRNTSPKKLRVGQVVSDEVRTHCECANRRISSRHSHFCQEKKLPNVIKVALANELARFIWAVGMMVERERASIA
jgi:transposase